MLIRDERGEYLAAPRLPGLSPLLPEPYYRTQLGEAFLGDSLHILPALPDKSVNLIITSPPFALQRKKDYGNVSPEAYVDWFRQFVDDFFRILADDGSLVIDIGGSWTKGAPTRTLYHFQLLIALCEKFHLAQEFYWYNPARLPSPAEWVTVRRIRVKDAVDPVWWLSKTSYPKADNRKVLQPYSDAMKHLLKNGYKAKKRPSGHDISEKFSREHAGAIPSNLLSISNTDSNSGYLSACRAAGIQPHPARFPASLPEFFIRFLTDEGDRVLDPFAGSNVAGEVSERLGRRWWAIEILPEYLDASTFRFRQQAMNLCPS